MNRKTDETNGCERARGLWVSTSGGYISWRIVGPPSYPARRGDFIIRAVAGTKVSESLGRVREKQRSHSRGSGSSSASVSLKTN